MAENKITTDAEVILMMYRDYLELSERYQRLEKERNKLGESLERIREVVEKAEIEKAEIECYSRKEVENTLVYTKEIKKAAGFPVGICIEADKILIERESKEDGETNDNN